MKRLFIVLGVLYLLVGVAWGYWLLTANAETTDWLSMNIYADQWYVGLLIAGLVLFLVHTMGDKSSRELKLRSIQFAVVVDTVMAIVLSLCCGAVLFVGCFSTVALFMLYVLLYGILSIFEGKKVLS